MSIVLPKHLCLQGVVDAIYVKKVLAYIYEVQNSRQNFGQVLHLLLWRQVEGQLEAVLAETLRIFRAEVQVSEVFGRFLKCCASEKQICDLVRH